MKLKLFTPFIVFFLFLISAQLSSASAATYYVSCTGSDSNNGLSTSSPYLTLSKASAIATAPGDQLLLNKGCTWSGQTLTLSRSGNSSQPIYIGAYGTGENPVITNNVSGKKDVIVTGSYLVIEYITAKAQAPAVETNCDNNPIGSIVGFSFESGASYNTLKNSKASGHYAGVFIRSGAHHNRIERNEFTNNNMMSPIDTASNNDAGAFGILLWGDDNEISYNTISGSEACSFDYVRDGAAIEIYGGQRNYIHHNIATQNDAFTELGNSRSSDNTFVYNKFTSTLTQSIFLVTRGSTTFGPVYRTRAYNNTVYLTGASSQGFVCSSCTPDILTFKNNIVVAGWKVGYVGGSFVEGNNVYWQGIRQFTVGSSSIVADPKFVNPSAGDLRLLAGSPAIERGTSDSIALGVTSDLAGNSIPFGPLPDAGAYEYTGGSNAPTPTPQSQGNGDVNGDGKVTVSDVLALFSSWFTSVTTSLDQYKDGVVNSFDFAVTASRLAVATTAPTQAPTTTPRPATPTPAPSQTPVATIVPTGTPVSGGTITIAAVGDINPSGVTSTTSASGKNAASIAAANPNAILMLGDWQYSYGTCSAIISGIDKLWGRFLPIMYPTAGPTHDWDGTNSNGQQYQTYFSGNCPGQTTGRAAAPVNPDPKAPYSWNMGKWHFVQLSSGCWRYSNCSGSSQTTWLANDLANAVATGHPYIVAFWHEPYWTSSTSQHSSNTPAVKPWIDLLYQYKAKIVMHGHQHGYERFLPQTNASTLDNENGIQSFTVGTGGIGFYPWSNKKTNSATQQTGTYGWLKLNLHDNGTYDWQFVPTSGGTYTDSGSR